MSLSEANQANYSVCHGPVATSLIAVNSGAHPNKGFRPERCFLQWWTIAFLTLPMVAHAELSTCPTLKHNPLLNVRLFAGPRSENAELVPDNEGGATWDVRGYKSPDQPQLFLLCEYKDGQSIEIAIGRSAKHCYVKGRKRIAGWCGK